MAQIPLHPKTMAFATNRLLSFKRSDKKFNHMKDIQLFSLILITPYLSINYFSDILY